MDSTCRLWSTRRGEQLFQINLPAPVTHIQVDLNQNIYCSCLNRLVVFSTKSLFKEQELPHYWQDSAIQKMIHELREVDNHRAPQPTRAKTAPAEQKQGVTLGELQKLIAHGILLPRALETIAAQFSDVNHANLMANMRKYNINHRQVQRLIANNSKFHPRDILHALSSNTNTNVLFSLISQGSPISHILGRMGYQPLSADDNIILYLNGADIDLGLREKIGSDKIKGVRFGSADDDDSSDSDIELTSEDQLEIDLAKQKGKVKYILWEVLHFIPSEQIKLIRGNFLLKLDLHSRKGLQPIFLRSLAAVEKEKGVSFPNFDPDKMPNAAGATPQAVKGQQNPRFNEM